MATAAAEKEPFPSRPVRRAELDDFRLPGAKRRGRIGNQHAPECHGLGRAALLFGPVQDRAVQAVAHQLPLRGRPVSAEPFMPLVDEFIEIEVADAGDTGAAWSSRDFVRHYYNGRGPGGTVRETGHLSGIVAQYMTSTVTKSPQDNIAEVAREHPNGAFSDVFENTYNMSGIVFSIGDTTIGGRFTGNCAAEFGILTATGQLGFYLEDEFADPADVGMEVVDLGETIYENIRRPLEDYLRGRVGLPPTGPQRLGILTGEPYSITDRWTGSFSGRIFADPARSRFG